MRILHREMSECSCQKQAAGSAQRIPIDYYRNPVLGRRSVAQLLQRRGLMGFSNLVWVSGDWRGLASPFCRIGREEPVAMECEPEYIRQESENAELEAAFAGPDSLVIAVKARRVLTLYSGAPGKIHHNGGTAHQQWMAFDAFRGGATLSQVADDTIVACNGAYCAAFIAPGIRMSGDGNGWSLALPAGSTYLGAGVGFRSQESAIAKARAALAALEADGGIGAIRRRLREEWERIFESFHWPAGLDAGDLPLARNAVWCIYSNLAAPEGCLKRPAIIASKIQYPGVFPWDSAFAAVALKEADPSLAKDQIEIYTDQISCSPDGRVGEMTALESGGGVQFPLLAWAAWRIHTAGADRGFLERVYEPLARHARWWLSAGGPHPGIPRYDQVICLDDSPRFDVFSGEGRMSLREPVLGADLIVLCALDNLHLAKIAEEIGLPAEAEAHRQTAARLVDFAESNLYDEALGRYIDLGMKTGTRSTVNTPMNHFPAQLSPSRKRRERAAKALSPEGPFWGKFGLATVSPEEASFDPCRIWRGPVWFSVNFLCAEACTAMGFPQMAGDIARSTIGLVRANAPLPRGIMEYFNYLTGDGSGAHHIATMSAAPFVSFLLGHHLENPLAAEKPERRAKAGLHRPVEVAA